MYIFEVYRENPNDELDSKSIKKFSDPSDCADYLSSMIPNDDLWTYRIVTWFTGYEGNWPEYAWSIYESVWADEWLEDLVID